MSTPTTRAEFRDHCLRALGHEVIQINVSPNQVEDRIDEALAFYRDYHYGGQKQVAIAHELTPTDLANMYIAIPSNVASIAAVYKSTLTATGLAGTDILSVQRALTISDVVLAGKGALKDYYIIRQNLQTLDHLLTPMIRYRFNINESILYLDVPWTTLKEGQWVVMETFVNIDPEEDPKTWGDRIFQNLATAYIKKQWGENLTKFTGIQLAGGVQLNGDAILADAKAEIERIETDFILKYQMPDDIFVG